MRSYLVEFEGYRARVERDREGILHGRVIDLQEVITFKAISFRMVESKFQLALLQYFSRCEKIGIKPEAPKSTGF
jgi:predicted HicB family RNase H-like nuclease